MHFQRTRKSSNIFEILFNIPNEWERILHFMQTNEHNVFKLDLKDSVVIVVLRAVGYGMEFKLELHNSQILNK